MAFPIEDSAEARIRDKLRKIEALYAQAATPGERDAAGAARERVLARLAQMAAHEPDIEVKYMLPDEWARDLFLALCLRYRLRPFRRRGTRHTTLMVRAPRSFHTEVLWPEFQDCHKALHQYLYEATQRVIRENITSAAVAVEEE